MTNWNAPVSVTLTHAEWLTVVIALWDSIEHDKTQDMRADLRAWRKDEKKALRDIIVGNLPEDNNEVARRFFERHARARLQDEKVGLRGIIMHTCEDNK